MPARRVLALDGDEFGRRWRPLSADFAAACHSAAPPLRLMRAYAGIRRHVQTMLWVRACHSAMVLTLSMLRTRNCVSPRLRAWALAHSAVAARSL